MSADTVEPPTLLPEDQPDITPIPNTTDDGITETQAIPLDGPYDAGMVLPENSTEAPGVNETPIDPDMCEMMYEVIFNMGASFISPDVEVLLPDARKKTQGKLLSRLFEKYNIQNDNMDAVLFMVGCAIDYKLVTDTKKDNIDMEVRTDG